MIHSWEKATSYKYIYSPSKSKVVSIFCISTFLKTILKIIVGITLIGPHITKAANTIINFLIFEFV